MSAGWSPLPNEADSGRLSDARRQLLAIYRKALLAVDGEQAVSRYLHSHPHDGAVHVVAIGKAAAAMARGAVAGLRDTLQRGLLITKYGHGEGFADPRFTVLESGHPIPDAASLRAGAALLQFIGETPPDGQLLFLISGGTSALVEQLPEGVGEAELARLNDWLLASGQPIAAINRIRKAASTIKAGRLAAHLGDRPCRVLMISDVPGDEPATIGSGLLLPHSRAQLATPAPDYPDWLNRLLGQAPPLADSAAFANIDIAVIASNTTAREAVAEAARAERLPVFLDAEPFEGEAEELGRGFARQLCQGGAGLYIHGGESTVRLPAEPGRGGRNQHLALAAAEELHGQHDCLLLAVGTDGSDGPTDDAGALVDGGTIERGREEGEDDNQALRCADSGTFLAASGDLVTTGPTGTNVMDLVLAWKRGG